MSTKAVWVPTEEYVHQTRLYQWMHKLGFADYEQFYQKSIEDIEWFWDEAVHELGIKWYTPYSHVLNLQQGVHWAKWFADGKTNVNLNAIDKWLLHPQVAQKPAILWENEHGQQRELLYSDLVQRVNEAAYGLQSLGVEKGDRILIYMPMLPETVITMLASAKIGAIFTPIFSGFAVDGVQKRIEAARPKVIVTADGFTRKGKAITMKRVVDEALLGDTTVETVVVVANLQLSLDVMAWHQHRDIAWDEMVSRGVLDETFIMNSDDPYMLIYTSGTTSKPKGIMHTHAGFPLKSAFDAGICMDLQQGDKMLWVTDMGWMMGPFLVYGTLLNGATMVLYDGSPDYPHQTRLWRLVETYSVSHLGVSPTLIRAMMSKVEKGDLEHIDLSSLKVFGSTGEPWNPEPWIWLFETIGDRRVPIFNYSGGTEISGGIFGNVLVKPIAPVGFNSALPGMDAAIYDKHGSPVTQADEVGELVLRKPWVGMASGFWQAPERYVQTYWGRWTDTWVHGDWVHLDTEGNWYITGRSDDTLNIAGKRMGPAEMESILIEHSLVREAGTIGVPDPLKGEAAVCFVVLNQSVPEKDKLSKLQVELFELVQRKLGKALSPKEIHVVLDLPKTRNAKIMRRVLRSAYLGQDLGDISALENPETIEDIRKCHKVI